MPTLGVIVAETVTFADRHDRREYEAGRCNQHADGMRPV